MSIIKYGKQFPDGSTELDIELWCYAHDDREEGEGGRLTKWDHFRNAVDLLWNGGDSSRTVIWNEWTERMLKAMIYNKFCACAGAGSCVSGDTRIFNPMTGGSPTIREMCERNERPWVQTVNGPKQAGIPYSKGESDVWEFRLSNGRSFKCTPEHALLAQSGWIRAKDATAGDWLLGYAPAPPQTIVDSARSAHDANDLHCFGKAANWMDGYSACSRLCGERLRLAQESVLAPLPLSGGAQKYSGCASLRVDGPCNESGHIHPCRSVFPSMRNAVRQGLRCLSRRFSQSRFSQGISSPLPSWSRRFFQFQTENIRLWPFVERFRDLCRMQNKDCVASRVLGLEPLLYEDKNEQRPPICQDGQLPGACSSCLETNSQFPVSSLDWVGDSYGLMVQDVQVVSIKKCGEMEFFDMDVPDEHHYFAEGVIHHNSGKSDAAAVFAITDWLSAPTERMFLVCSTTLAGARGRIWKSVSELWSALASKWEREGVTAPGKMVESKGRIVGLDINGRWSESVGIWLIAAGKDDEGEADKKLKGLKAPSGGQLRLIADEFSDLGMCVFTAMVGNMSSTPGFKGIGMANPGSKLTPFGRFVTPKDGWNSLSVGMEQWETNYGVCLSFDAHKSPRALTPEHEVKMSDGSFFHRLYNWMPSSQYIAQAKMAFGEDSMEYWAQIRGMFCPTGMERTVWSEIELLNASSKVAPTEWDSPPSSMCAAMDPAFVTGGDRAPIMWAEFGTIKGVKTMNFLGYKIVQEAAGKGITDSGEEVDITVSESAINQFREHCEFHQIPPKRAGFDATGGGVVFGQWLHTKWSHAVHGIRFGEKPVERRPDSTNDEKIYKNRVTQLWVQPKALVRMGQIRGLPEDVIAELCQRKWHATRHTSSCACVEEKSDMKKRLGRSPDLADAFVILVEVAILNGLLDVMEIRRDDRRINQMFNQILDGKDPKNMGPTKSLIAMPRVKRLAFSGRSSKIKHR